MGLVAAECRCLVNEPSLLEHQCGSKRNFRDKEAVFTSMDAFVAKPETQRKIYIGLMIYKKTKMGTMKDHGHAGKLIKETSSDLKHRCCLHLVQIQNLFSLFLLMKQLTRRTYFIDIPYLQAMATKMTSIPSNCQRKSNIQGISTNPNFQLHPALNLR